MRRPVALTAAMRGAATARSVNACVAASCSGTALSRTAGVANVRSANVRSANVRSANGCDTPSGLLGAPGCHKLPARRMGAGAVQKLWTFGG